MEEEKVTYGKAELLVMEGKAVFTLLHFAASILFLTFRTA